MIFLVDALVIVSDLAVAAHVLVRVVWPTVGVLAAAVHLCLGLVRELRVLWFQLKTIFECFTVLLLTSHCVMGSKPIKAW